MIFRVSSQGTVPWMSMWHYTWWSVIMQVCIIFRPLRINRVVLNHLFCTFYNEIRFSIHSGTELSVWPCIRAYEWWESTANVMQFSVLTWKWERRVSCWIEVSTVERPANYSKCMSSSIKIDFGLNVNAGWKNGTVSNVWSTPFVRPCIMLVCWIPVGLFFYSGHPAWAQNDAMMEAYMDNMAYYYRVNDDTVLESTGWTEKLIEQLLRFHPPNVGVAGPWFRDGNIAILTHDFVHRTHVDIFGFYYPRVFTDWFADDWITGVYWPERARKVPGTRIKHTMEMGNRYVVNFEKANRWPIFSCDCVGDLYCGVPGPYRLSVFTYIKW